MGDDTTEGPTYRFPWKYLADCLLTSEENIYDCAFSRALIADRDLAKMSERTADDDADDLSEMTIASTSAPGIVQNEQSVLDGDVEVLENSRDLLTAAAWEQIPKQFGKTTKKLANKKRKPNSGFGSGKQTWLKNVSFAEYWDVTCSYLIYKTWLDDFGDEMSAEDKANLEAEVVSYKPDVSCLLDEHRELKNYRQLSMKDSSYASLSLKSFRDVFNLHCQLVHQMAEKDFALFKAAQTAHKCAQFFKKIEGMGFVSGYGTKTTAYDEVQKQEELEDGEILETNETPTEVETPVPKKAKSMGERYPVVYGDDEVFNDITYDILDPYSANMKIVLNNRTAPSDSGVKADCIENQGDVSKQDGEVDQKNISFAFDPEKESYLLARNARQYYRHDPEIRKYFFQRYRLFSKLDKGVLMDREGWFSVTPERIAEHIADRMVLKPGVVIVDAFAGVGGNSIQFALKGAHVFAIDLDPVRLKCARENAKVYGVEKNIEFICCNFFHFADKWMKRQEGEPSQIDSVFLSPPWGGPDYLKTKEFDLGVGLTPNGFDIFTAARAMSPNIAYFLPRNTSMKQLISLAGPGGRCEIEQSVLSKKIKTITAYFGNLAIPRTEE